MRESVVASLLARLDRLKRPLFADEVGERPDLNGWIADMDIMEEVERHLRERKQRVAHVLYALSVRGRADRDGRTGWSTARDLLHWLYDESNYQDLALDLPPLQPVQGDRWWPAANASNPQNVIKHDNRTRPFSRNQFEGSIQKALLGRPHADQAAHLVAEWVLWGVIGQPTVNSSQLGVGVLDCLRRVDDIAYLRWAAIFKRFSTVTQVRDEAQALLTHPSAQLRFDVDHKPRRPVGPRSV